jgi:transcriptional regulator with XRE-family HTH domain
MGQQRHPGGFGTYLKEAIQLAGYATPTNFARQIGTDPSVVLRWISEEQRPTIRSIERMAPLLGKTITELVMAAYPDRLGLVPRPAITQTHPLAAELARMLASESPIPMQDRQALESVLGKILDPYRKIMRRRNSA